jgi:hypothetical protein
MAKTSRDRFHKAILSTAARCANTARSPEGPWFRPTDEFVLAERRGAVGEHQHRGATLFDAVTPEPGRPATAIEGRSKGARSSLLEVIRFAARLMVSP